MEITAYAKKHNVSQVGNGNRGNSKKKVSMKANPIKTAYTVKGVNATEPTTQTGFGMFMALHLFILLLIATPTWAAIAVEGSASAGGTGGTSGSFAVDCGANPNRFLFVGSLLNSAIANLTTLTFGSINVPIIYDQLDAGGTNPVIVAVLTAPASGSNTLEWAIDTVTNMVIGATCLSDVDQSTPYGTLVAAEFVAASPTVNVTVATDGMAIDWLAYAGFGGGSFTAGAGQTERLQQDNGNDSLGGAISTEVAVGTVTMSWTEVPSACCYNTVVALPLNKAAAAPTSDFFSRRR